MRQDQDGNEKETDPTSSSQPPSPPPLLPGRCFTTAEFVQLEFTLFPKEAQPNAHEKDSFQRLLHINLHSKPNSKPSGDAGFKLKREKD